MSTNHNPRKSSTPSNDEVALIALMRADAAVWADRNADDNDSEAIETARREKIRAARLGKKQSPQLIAKRVAGFKATRARRAQSQPVVSPTTRRARAPGKHRRTAHG